MLCSLFSSFEDNYSALHLENRKKSFSILPNHIVYKEANIRKIHLLSKL